jgi:hypothetical protein
MGLNAVQELVYGSEEVCTLYGVEKLIEWNDVLRAHT